MSAPEEKLAGTRDGRALAWILACVLPPFVALVLRFGFVVDDAFISFRYARNLARGRGLVFNPLERDPVEGFTNLGWVLWMAPFEALGLDPTAVSRATSIACAVLLLALFAGLARRALALPLPLASAATLFLATLPPFACWTTGGLETMPFALAVFAVYERLGRPAARFAVAQASSAACAALLLRADGFVWVAIALAAAWLAARGDPARRAAVLRCALAAAVGCALHFAWRRATFGAWVPNTARVKVGLSWLRLERGLLYDLALLASVPALFVALSWTAVRMAASRALRARGHALPAALAAAAGLAYTALVGGDWMCLFRLLVPALPFAALAFAAVLAQGLEGRAARRRLVLASALAALSVLSCFDLHPLPRALRERTFFRWSDAAYLTEIECWERDRDFSAEWTALGRALALHARPGESIVLGAIGAQGYYSGLWVHDLHGLTNHEALPEEERGARRSPGHDRVLHEVDFRKYRPTYFAAVLVPADDPLSSVPSAWRDPSAEIHSAVELSTHPLPAEGPFPPGKALLLVRYRW